MNEHSGLDVTLNSCAAAGREHAEFFYRHGAGPHRERSPSRWPSACKNLRMDVQRRRPAGATP